MARWVYFRQILDRIAFAVIAIGACWNILTFSHNVDSLPVRNADELVVLEKQLAPIRQVLSEHGYLNGHVSFITNRDLAAQPGTGEDNKRRFQTQYLMIPWTLVPDYRSTRFVIADFWDGVPADFSLRFHSLYDSGDGVILAERRPTVP